MVSRNYLILILLVWFITPLFAFSQNQDYLFVFGTYDGANYTIDSVEQRAVPVNNVSSTDGDYEIRLYKKSKLISKVSFDISEPGPVEVSTRSGYLESTQKQVIFTAVVPLNVSVDVNQAKLQLLKSDQVLLEKELTEIPVTILSVAVNELKTLERIESERAADRSNNLFIYISIVAGLLVAGWYLWKRKNMVKLTRDLYRE